MTDGRRRIVFVINSLAGGGAERVFCTLLANSRSHLEDFDMEVVLLDNDEEAYTLPDWLKVVRLDCRHKLGASILRLRRYLRETRPDAVVAFLTRSNVAAVIGARSIGIPSIISERVHTAAHLSSGRFAALSRALVHYAYPKATRIVPVSDGVGRGLVNHFGVDPNRLTTCYNPIDVNAIRKAAQEPPPFPVQPDDVVAMGRLVPNKNFALAIEAFKNYSATGRLLILGKGPLQEALEQQIKAAGLTDRVLLMGFHQNPHAIVARSALFLQTSNAEGFSNALVEAMTNGVPCVTTDCPSGPREILLAEPPERGCFTTGQGGLLVPMHDVEACTKALEAAHEPAMHARLAAEGRERVHAFTLERAVTSLWGAVHQAMDGPA